MVSEVEMLLFFSLENAILFEAAAISGSILSIFKDMQVKKNLFFFFVIR